MIELSSRQVVNDTEPTPACALLSLVSFAFTWATNSFRSLAGKSFLASTRIGVPAIMPIGSKSVRGSYCSFG